MNVHHLLSEAEQRQFAEFLNNLAEEPSPQSDPSLSTASGFPSIPFSDPVVPLDFPSQTPPLSQPHNALSATQWLQQQQQQIPATAPLLTRLEESSTTDLTTGLPYMCNDRLSIVIPTNSPTKTRPRQNASSQQPPQPSHSPSLPISQKLNASVPQLPSGSVSQPAPTTSHQPQTVPQIQPRISYPAYPNPYSHPHPMMYQYHVPSSAAAPISMPGPGPSNSSASQPDASKSVTPTPAPGRPSTNNAIPRQHPQPLTVPHQKCKPTPSPPQPIDQSQCSNVNEKAQSAAPAPFAHPPPPSTLASHIQITPAISSNTQSIRADAPPPVRKRKSSVHHDAFAKLNTKRRASTISQASSQSSSSGIPAFQASKPEGEDELGKSEGQVGKRGGKQLLTEEEKRANHIESEKKRRQNIRTGFDQLVEIVPSLNQCHRSEALILQRGKCAVTITGSLPSL